MADINYRIIRLPYQLDEIKKYSDNYQCFDPDILKCGKVVFSYDNSGEIVGAIGLEYSSGGYIIAVNNTYTTEHFAGIINYFQCIYSQYSGKHNDKFANINLYIDVSHELLFREYSHLGFIISGKSADGVIHMVRDTKSAIICDTFHFRTNVYVFDHCFELHSFELHYCGKKIAYISYKFICDDSDEHFYVDFLYVKEKYRKYGMGKFLLQILINYSEFYEKNIKLRSINKSSGFYGKMKFIQTSEHDYKGSVDMEYQC